MHRSMTIKALGAALLALGLTTAAQATPRDETFSVTFRFSPDAPVEKTYADFRKTAERACRANVATISLLPRSDEATRACEEELMIKAVLKSRAENLIEYHEQQTRTGS